MSTRFTITTPKPRNPLVAPSRRRLAGAHRGGDRRQQARHGLRRELRELHPPSP